MTSRSRHRASGPSQIGGTQCQRDPFSETSTCPAPWLSWGAPRPDLSPSVPGASIEGSSESPNLSLQRGAGNYGPEEMRWPSAMLVPGGAGAFARHFNLVATVASQPIPRLVPIYDCNLAISSFISIWAGATRLLRGGAGAERICWAQQQLQDTQVAVCTAHVVLSKATHRQLISACLAQHAKSCASCFSVNHSYRNPWAVRAATRLYAQLSGLLSQVPVATATTFLCCRRIGTRMTMLGSK